MSFKRWLPFLLLATVALLFGCKRLPAPFFAKPDPGAPPSAPVFPDIVLPAQSGRVSVIMYHDVIESRGPGSVWFDCTVDEFKRDIQEIVDNGFTVLTLDQLYAHLTTGAPVPPRSVVLTFDDNYQGFYDHALPILKEHGFPAAVFVHTAYVGNQTGDHPKMTWDELKELRDGGLITIGAHTVTHPENLKDLPPDVQRKELVDSKATLEAQLGIPIPYMAYPVGSADQVTEDLAREAGYKMSFTMEPTPAEGSPSILMVGRYEAKKFHEALAAQVAELNAGAPAVVDHPLVPAPVSAEAGKFGGIRLVLLRGGTPMSVLADGRKTVGEFVTEGKAVAGINGSFFVMAAIASTDNRLIGPAKPQNRPEFMVDPDPFRVAKLRDRPMVVWGPNRIAFASFQPGAMNDEAIYRRFMPDFTDAFLGGAWIVHEGVARTEAQLKPYASQDIQDYRKRVFFGIDGEGKILCGASQGSVTTIDLANAAVAAGAREAVLLDSGFSASIVFDGRILVSGHSNIEHASRPVPHAILLMGEKGSASLGDLKTVPVTSAPSGEELMNEPPKRRARRRRPH